MKVKVSPLAIKDFRVLNFHYAFVAPPKEPIKDVKVLFSSYSIDIDFMHQDSENETFEVRCKIGINDLKKPKPGYTVFIEGMAFFALTEENIEEDIAKNLKYFSSLNMMINNLRNIIFQNTNIAPLGAYILPPIDINHLFEQKMKNLKKKRTK